MTMRALLAGFVVDRERDYCGCYESVCDCRDRIFLQCTKCQEQVVRDIIDRSLPELVEAAGNHRCK